MKLSSITFLLAYALCYSGNCQITFVNATPETINLSITKYSDGMWKSSGWYQIKPFGTFVAIQKPTNQYYYYYAESASKTWSGYDGKIWIHPTKAFNTIEGTSYDPSLGFKTVGIRKVDLGLRLEGVTITLDLRSDFAIQLDKYLKSNSLDPVEGLYTISDEIYVDYSGFFAPADKQEKRDHWAKVAVIRDTMSLSRNYVEFVLEAQGYLEGDIRAEFLKTKQNPNLLISDQAVSKNEPLRSAMFEYEKDESIIRGNIIYKKEDAEIRVKRTYIKYFPKD